MEEQEFLALIKLVSGEEVISMTSEIEEDDIKLLILNHPLTISEVKTSKKEGIKFNHWMKLSDDYIHIINFDKVITLSKVKSMELNFLYKKFVNKFGQSEYLQTKTTQVPLSKDLGLIGNIEDTRSNLENLFKAKSISSEP